MTTVRLIFVLLSFALPALGSTTVYQRIEKAFQQGTSLSTGDLKQSFSKVWNCSTLNNPWNLVQQKIDLNIVHHEDQLIGLHETKGTIRGDFFYFGRAGKLLDLPTGELGMSVVGSFNSGGITYTYTVPHSHGRSETVDGHPHTCVYKEQLELRKTAPLGPNKDPFLVVHYVSSDCRSPDVLELCCYVKAAL